PGAVHVQGREVLPDHVRGAEPVGDGRHAQLAVAVGPVEEAVAVVQAVGVAGRAGVGEAAPGPVRAAHAAVVAAAAEQAGGVGPVRAGGGAGVVGRAQEGRDVGGVGGRHVLEGGLQAGRLAEVALGVEGGLLDVGQDAGHPAPGPAVGVVAIEVGVGVLREVLGGVV